MQTPDLTAYWDKLSCAERHAIAKKAKTSYVYLWHVCHGKRRVGHGKARLYANAMGLPLHVIRPDIWQ